MPLDPQAATLIARTAANPPVHTVPVAQQRAGGSRSVILQGAPEQIASIDHKFVATPTADIPIRIYRPSLDAGLPALVYYPGGGFTLGNLDTVDIPIRAIANRAGCCIVTVNYQKAPEHKFPIPLDDCVAATLWVVEHAKEFGLDPDRIAVGGDSAGGNLAAAVCLKMRDEAPKVRLAHQFLIYPMLDCSMNTESYRTCATGYMVGRADMAWFWDNYLRDETDGLNPLAAPIIADLHDLPAATVFVAEFDTLHDEGVAYAARLRDAGVEANVVEYGGMIHGFLWMADVVDQGKALYADLGRRLHAVFMPALATETG